MHEITNSRVSEIRVSAATDIGRRRKRNEDAVLVVDLNTGISAPGGRETTHEIGERGTLLVVSDGVGGTPAGDLASEMTVAEIAEALSYLPTDLSGSLRIRFAVEAANERIWMRAQAAPQLRGMAATATAVLIQGGRVKVAQVGDSRAYLLHGESMQQLTKDQSLAQMVLDTGSIKPGEIRSVPRNVILQALGASCNIDPTLSSVELQENDYLLLCSDGLWGKVNADEMAQILQKAPDHAAACRRLIEMANERGGEDNISIIVAQVIKSSPSRATVHSMNRYLRRYESDDQPRTAA